MAARCAPCRRWMAPHAAAWQAVLGAGAPRPSGRPVARNLGITPAAASAAGSPWSRGLVSHDIPDAARAAERGWAAMSRLPSGGRIDRGTVLSFTFDGEEMHGHPGDTLASALLAQDRHFVARSIKYHRPRGILSAGIEEPSALVTVADATGFDAEPEGHRGCASRRASRLQPERLAPPGKGCGRADRAGWQGAGRGLLLQDLPLAGRRLVGNLVPPDPPHGRARQGRSAPGPGAVRQAP